MPVAESLRAQVADLRELLDDLDSAETNAEIDEANGRLDRARRWWHMADHLRREAADLAATLRRAQL